jgi:hypothetical protein
MHQLAPGEHRTVGGSQQDPPPHLRKGHRLDLADDGTRWRGRGGSTLWVFWNKSALRADLRGFQSIGCRALGCAVPRGPHKHLSAAPWGALYRRGVTKDTRPHLRKGHRLDLVDDMTRWRGRLRLDVMGFLEQVCTSCGPQRLSNRRMPGLVGVRFLGVLNKHLSAAPWGALHRRGVTKDPRPHLHKGHGLDLVHDMTRWRGRLRLDVMGFLEQVSTSCGPQSLSKHRMPGLVGVRSLGVLTNTSRQPPGEHCTVGGSQRTLGHTSTRDMGLTWFTTGPAGVGGCGSTLWVFWNKSALRADLRGFQSIGCRALWVCGPSGSSQTPLGRPLGSIAPSGGHKGPSATPP